MFGALESVEQALTAFAADFDPAGVPTDRVVPAYEQLVRIERTLASLRTLLAAQVDESMQWQRLGYKTSAEFLAATSGSTVAEAQRTLATSVGLAALPVVEDALRSGKLSAAQAALVTDAAAPAQQSRLVEEAQRSSLHELRGECLRTKASADPTRAATHQRLHEARHLRTFVDAEGAWNMVARATVDVGSRIEAGLRPFVEAEFERARTEGRRESYDAYALDALTRLCEGASPISDQASARPATPAVHTLALLRVDFAALRRGHAATANCARSPGSGPSPYTLLGDMLGESIAKLVITDGVAVRNVTHLGRGPTVAQRMALLFEQPLCSVEGCYRTRTEIDHTDSWADTHCTRLG